MHFLQKFKICIHGPFRRQNPSGSIQSISSAQVTVSDPSIALVPSLQETEPEGENEDGLEMISAKDLELQSRPAASQAHVLSMDAMAEQERAENAAQDVHVVVERLDQRRQILSQSSCACCRAEDRVRSI